MLLTSGYDVDNKVNYFRAWTITADEKNTFEAQPTDFIEEGDTDVLHHAFYPQDAVRASAGIRST